MPGIQYLALLRGINVGGNNVIRMADLKECFEKAGFSDVKTYIQSGNVIFRSEEKENESLVFLIEKELSDRFSYSSRIVLVTHSQLNDIIKEAPPGFGEDPSEYRYDVIFLRNKLMPADLIYSLRIKEGVDSVFAGNHTLYFSRLISRAAQSHLKYLLNHPVYRQLTIRNWNTTNSLNTIMNNGK